LGAVIREVREHRGLTIEALAAAATIDPSFLSGIERRLRKPSLEKIKAIATVLGTEAWELVKLAEERERGLPGRREPA
jgi:transcriptional regulator with XRE-family HTH domain